MKLKLVLAAALLGGFVTSAHADCTELVAQVDSMLATETHDMNEEVLGQIMTLRNEGTQECDNGNDEAATESLEKAISMFTQ